MDEKPRKYWSEGFAAQYMIQIPKLRESLPESKNFLGDNEARGDALRRVLRTIDPLQTTTPNKSQFAIRPSRLPKPKKKKAYG